MLLAQITDLHVVAPGRGPQYGVDSNAMLAAAVDRLNGFDPAPDALVITGDMVDLGVPEEYAVLRSELARLAVPVYLVAGNHDERAGLRTAFADHGYLPPGDGALNWCVEAHPLRLIGLDSTIPGRHDGALDDASLAWLDARLAERPDAPTVVALHHPPFETGIWWMDRGGLLQGGPGLRAVVQRHPQVRRVVCGHHHRPITTSWGSAVVSVCPSTAHQVHLDLAPESRPSFVTEPPMLQLHRWNAEELVTHNAYVQPTPPIDLLETWGGDWSKLRGRFRERRPMYKTGPQ
ncbi:MAG: phosphodiesterase [Acidimicrobiales bacterium]